MPRTVLMGAPDYFSVLGGANPHTRTALGLKKKVAPDLACEQWHALARALTAYGVEVCVLEPHRGMSGLVYPANAGVLYPLTGGAEPSVAKTFYLSHLLPTRAAERAAYRPFIRKMGYHTAEIRARFEGEADFFPAGGLMLFTYGEIERQRFVARLGWPPWRRIYGFRSEIGVLGELQRIAGGREVLALGLRLEAHYHGDTVLCSFGPKREFLLAHMDGLTLEAQRVLRERFGGNLIELSREDAAVYAANAFQTDFEGRLYLFLPNGVTGRLLAAVRERGVAPVTVDVSEFLAKGGGSVKCMILDLGPADEQPGAGAAFRAARSYRNLYARRGTSA